ncbi:MAG: peptidylprolyl isomerase [Chloroflexi bacterium]|nr:peptidylprolyl isomerase [Chloroflexota bacterium]|tara:strand:+ start:1503 stop:2012 length:510 start_codon:yes stop_codon:yes gene_type:complete
MSAQKWDAPPEMIIDPSETYQAVMTLDSGEVVIELLTDVAPITVNNFVFLAREGFYDGTTFHRVIPGFVAQGGDPTGTGTGGPGYQFQDELSEVPFEQGIVGMANAGPNTNGSQFYLMLDAAPHLTNRYTAFGRVTEGLENVLAITPRDPMSASQPGDEIISIVVESAS